MQLFGFPKQYRDVFQGPYLRWVFDFNFYLPHHLSCRKHFSAISPELASATCAKVDQILLHVSGVHFLPHLALEYSPYFASFLMLSSQWFLYFFHVFLLFSETARSRSHFDQLFALPPPIFSI